jgi:hypothetical protein
MPLPVNTTSAGSMPSGASGLQTGGDTDPTELTSAVTPNQQTAGQQAQGSATPWMPVFQIGSGQSGVPNTARGLISGFQSTQTVGQTTANSATTALQNALAANTPAGSATGSAGSSGGAAGETPGNANGLPTPKASSLAQQQANNAEAQREFPNYQGATG